MSPQFGQSDISKAFLVSPVLDFLKLLMLINEADGSANHGDDQRLAEPSFPSPHMFLSDLARAMLMPTANPDFGPSIETLRSVHGAFEAAANKRRESAVKSHQKIQELEAALREQSAAVDRLLGHRSGEQPLNAALAAFQQTLFLQCPRGGRTAGHFRCVNRTDQSSRCRHSRAQHAGH